MSTYYTYVVISLKDTFFNIGHTNNLKDRVKRHNDGRVKATKGRRPLKLFYFKEYETRSEAARYERYLKSFKGNDKFKEIIGYKD